jgi:hypothetical protein
MRKSRQPRCSAAIPGITPLKSSKLLDAEWNFSQAIFVVTASASLWVQKLRRMAAS